MVILKFLGIIVALGALIILGIKVLLPAATKAAEQKKTFLAFVLITLQFVIFLASFTLMLYFAMAFISRFQQ